MARGEDPSSAILTSPEAMAAITSAPEANCRHSMSQPVAASKAPSARATCMGVGLPNWPITTVSAEAAALQSARAAAPARKVLVVISCLLC